MGVLAHWLRVMQTAILVVCLSATVSIAQQNDAGPAIGPETNLPVPRFVSLRAHEANVRRGPSLSHRIDWIFKRRDMPLQVIAEYGHWRRVIDRDGQGGVAVGWVRDVCQRAAGEFYNERIDPIAFRTTNADSGGPESVCELVE